MCGIVEIRIKRLKTTAQYQSPGDQQGPWRARSQCRSAATRKAEAVLANTMMAHPRSIFIRVCLPAQSSYCASEKPRR
ncbi:hypothetical protein GOL41_33570 [Sinorhizobium medicae]|nr:hypothetical protein [Sinorhizobium medicae]RVK07942.1 hypothetical protein CN165_32360 [Sinorhizobium medicae]RVP67875.1 hypothetical protein CN079_31890 [Sinorhizobium medicae]